MRTKTYTSALVAASFAVLVATAPVQGGEPATAGKAAQSCEGLKASIVGKPGDDKKLRGTKGNDVIAARGGDDYIVGNGGEDVICGGAGDDFVEGGSGDDLVNGDSGKDIILGDGGTDKLFGKDGDDAIQGGKSGGDLCHGGPGDDLALQSNCERIRSARAVRAGF